MLRKDLTGDVIYMYNINMLQNKKTPLLSLSIDVRKMVLDIINLGNYFFVGSTWIFGQFDVQYQDVSISVQTDTDKSAEHNTATGNTLNG